jgi:Polyketide cyclase / dehydrase and lipid transport
VRIVGSIKINRPADQVWAYVADYGNDTSWRASARQMHPSRPGPAQVGVTTHEVLRLLGLTFRTDASIDRVDAGRLLEWHPTIGKSSCEGLGWWSRPAKAAAASPRWSRAVCSVCCDPWSRW